ncbi:aspartyl aminopeptidase [Lachnospiraceae bacterium KM106-2]|nr:aspartyl aminopeptidase [Lachnospiraceae bacterium KM106-2]
MNKMTTQLMELLEASVSPFHAVEASKERLREAGFKELHISECFNLEKKQGYFVDLYGSSLMAFRVNEAFEIGDPFRVAAAHTDFPNLRIKFNPDMVEGKYRKLNVEVYGGMILNTWLDRPLSIAGRVSLRSDNIFRPEVRLVDFKKPVLTIPNLAIHLDREINKGKELNRQIDMAPLAGMIKGQLEEKDSFLTILAEEMGVAKEDILDFELGVYNVEKPCLTGFKEEFLSSPRLDNITSVNACLEGITAGERVKGIDVICLYDHEEIGSRSKKGAASNLLATLLEKIYRALGGTKEQYVNAMLESFGLSVDVAHGIHPNHPEKMDVTNKVYLNEGVAIKNASSQSYASDCEMNGVITALCKKYKVQYQNFYNRSDASSGGTLGAIANANLPMRIQDIGVPLLAMHSAREVMGIQDQEALNALLTGFFTE